MDQNEISTVASKSPSRHWKTVNWKTSGQWKTLEKEQADLLKLFSGRVTDQEGYLTQNETMTADSAYRGFFEKYNNLEAIRKQQKLLLKPNYIEALDNETKRMLEEKSKVFRWVVDKVPFLRDIEMLRTHFSGYCEDPLWAYKTVKAAHPIFNELTNLKNKLKTEISSDSDIV